MLEPEGASGRGVHLPHAHLEWVDSRAGEGGYGTLPPIATPPDLTRRAARAQMGIDIDSLPASAH